MSLLHDAYIGLLSGLTYKTKNEIHWYSEYKEPITVEPTNIINDEYIVRYYYNDKKCCEIGYCKNKLHGKYISWYLNGQKRLETSYQNGKCHGKSEWWSDDGHLISKIEYRNGLPVFPVVNGKMLKLGL